MIKLEVIQANILKVMAPEKLEAYDFLQLEPQVDTLISQYGKIRLLVDLSGFGGWENIEAFENHVGFVKTHQQKVERIAVLVGHNWQHGLASLLKMFLHPDIKSYDKIQESEALQWITEPSE
jgi:hypothetical protein